jgi:hypothetical protein
MIVLTGQALEFRKDIFSRFKMFTLDFSAPKNPRSKVTGFGVQGS